MTEPDWKKLPEGVFPIIFRSLSSLDFFNVWCVCETWFMAAYGNRDCIGMGNQVPWVLINGETKIVLDPQSGKRWTVQMPSLKEAVIVASKDGWLLVSKEKNMYFLHPLTPGHIYLPSMGESVNCAAFSCSPTKKECTVITLKEEHLGSPFKVNVIRRGDFEWTSYHFNQYMSMRFIPHSAVMVKGVLNCMDKAGTVRVFNHEVDGDDKWTKINQGTTNIPLLDRDKYRIDGRCLIELNEEVYRFLPHFRGKLNVIQKLCYEEKEYVSTDMEMEVKLVRRPKWKSVENLPKSIMCVGSSIGFGSTTDGNLENKLFLSMVHNSECAIFDVASKITSSCELLRTCECNTQGVFFKPQWPKVPAGCCYEDLSSTPSGSIEESQIRNIGGQVDSGSI